MSEPLYEVDVDEMGLSAADHTLMRAVADTLWREYPGHVWCVAPATNQGVVVIQCFGLDETIDWRNPLMMGYRLKLADLDGDPTLRKVVMAGGEILERAGVPRGRRLS